jgi:disulfide bond formation protein DsbB
MAPWVKVVTEPLGLAGFVLFLVFGYLAKTKRNDERRWLSLVSFAIATLALVGSLAIAYAKVSRSNPPAVQTSTTTIPARQQTNQQVQQSSAGDGSPNVQGVQGDVAITVDQSSGKMATKTKKPAGKKPAHEEQ